LQYDRRPDRDATRDRADAEQPPRAGGPTRYQLPPDLQKLVRSILADYPELSEEKAVEMCQAFW
jgi:hypothetical protein